MIDTNMLNETMSRFSVDNNKKEYELTREDIVENIGSSILDNLLDYWNDFCRNQNEDWEYHHSEDEIRKHFPGQLEGTSGWQNFALNKLMKDKIFLARLHDLAKDVAENEEMGW